jgi:hypothetical protein
VLASELNPTTSIAIDSTAASRPGFTRPPSAASPFREDAILSPDEEDSSSCTFFG